jgi:hypothetical protein
MLVAVVAAMVMSQQIGTAVQEFNAIPAADVPASVFEVGQLLCDAREPAECRRRFVQKGGAWAGDVNGDGVRELLLQGAELSGTGGSLYFLYQRQGKSWQSLSAEPQNTDAITLTPSPRFDILPVVRSRYHDLRLSVTGCFKWNGTGYVPYETSDYHALQAGWFDASKLDEAELFWAIRYRGAPSVTLNPQWFAGRPEWGASVELEDQMLKLRWVAMFKGGVYGVERDRCFLLLPRPAYGGAERLEIDGDWLVVFASVSLEHVDPKLEVREVARYNRRTREIRVGSHAE